MYQYCLDGWSGPTDILMLERLGISAYPNPSKGTVYFTTKLDVEVYNLLGENVDNFSDAFSALIESDGCIFVKNKNQFLKAIRYLEDIKNADNMGKIAKDVLKEFSDPTKNIINFIKIHLIGQRQDYD